MKTCGLVGVAVALLVLGAACGDPGGTDGSDTGGGGVGATTGAGGDGTGDDTGDETGDETGDTGDDTGGTGDTGDDTGRVGGGGDTSDETGEVEDTPEPLCPAAGVESFEVGGGLRYAHFEEVIDVEAVITGEGVTATLEVSPASLADFFVDHGDGTGTFQQTEVETTWATTPATFRLTVEVDGCEDTFETGLKVLGNVWAARQEGVVEIYRSDGSFFMQGIPSSWLEDPWSLLQLGEQTVLVGQRWEIGVEAFDLDGNHLFSFDTLDDDGQGLWSVYGAYALMQHQPDGALWVGGPRGKILVFDHEGAWQHTILTYWDNVEVEDLLQLKDGTSVLIDDAHWYEMRLLDTDGTDIGEYADNSDEIPKFTGKAVAMTPDGHVVIAGTSGSPTVYGRLLKLKPAGQLLQASELLEFELDYDMIAFGDGFLASHDAEGVAWFDEDLQLLDETWTGDKVGKFRGLMILGGN